MIKARPDLAPCPRGHVSREGWREGPPEAVAFQSSTQNPGPAHSPWESPPQPPRLMGFPLRHCIILTQFFHSQRRLIFRIRGQHLKIRSYKFPIFCKIGSSTPGLSGSGAAEWLLSADGGCWLAADPSQPWTPTHKKRLAL